VLLFVAAALISVGPGTLAELFAGVFFARPEAGTRATPAPSHADAALQASLDGVVAGYAPGTLGIVLVDLQTGATAGVNPERSFPAASLFKLPILLEVLAAQDAGRLDSQRLLEIKPEDWTDGSGVLQARVGERLPVRELTRLMIQESDNIAALVLLDAVGVGRVNATVQRLGMRSTRLIDHRGGEPGEHSTSAADMAQLMVRLVAGTAVNQRVSEEALRLLELKQTFTWLADRLPFWVKVAHKWGDLPDARNDVGVVFSPRGSYVVAALAADSQPDAAAEAIAGASRATYDYLGSRAGPS
jgi:beta-lactamase class A